MPYRLLADLSILFHFIWILFLIFGIIFALKRSRWAWLHLGGILFSLFINLLGMYCPLTYLENYFRRLQGEVAAYTGSFIVRYIELIIYPDVPEKAIRAGEILFVCVNLGVYGLIAKKYCRGSNT